MNSTLRTILLLNVIWLSACASQSPIPNRSERSLDAHCPPMVERDLSGSDKKTEPEL